MGVSHVLGNKNTGPAICQGDEHVEMDALSAVEGKMLKGKGKVPRS